MCSKPSRSSAFAPLSAQPARTERCTVYRERTHSTDVESTTYTSWAAMVACCPNALTSHGIVEVGLRSRLLSPNCPGKGENMPQGSTWRTAAIVAHW